MHQPKGFRGELKQMFDSLDKVVNSSNTLQQTTLTVSQQVISFFAHLDYSLYNQEEINKIKKKVDEIIPQYIDAIHGLKTEEPKANASGGKLFQIFLLGGTAIGLQTAIFSYLIAPSITPVSFLVGFWGGIYLTDVVDGKLNSKYENFKKQKKDLEKECMSQIN